MLLAAICTAACAQPCRHGDSHTWGLYSHTWGLYSRTCSKPAEPPCTAQLLMRLLLLCEGFTPCQREDRRVSSRGEVSPCSAWPSARIAGPLPSAPGTILYGKACMHAPERCNGTVLCSVASVRSGVKSHKGHCTGIAGLASKASLYVCHLLCPQHSPLAGLGGSLKADGTAFSGKLSLELQN